MKSKLIALISLLAVVTSIAATFTVTIVPSPTPGVTYRIYSSTNNGATWTAELNTTNLLITISNAPIPVIYSVTAFNTNGESGKVTAETLYRPSGVRIVEQ